LIVHAPTDSQRSRSPLSRVALFASCLGLMVLAAIQAEVTQREKAVQSSVLKLTVVDELTGKPTPARLELLDDQGKAYVADDALVFSGPSTQKIRDPYHGADQFYCTGKAQVSLPPGAYKLRAFKGNEYRVTAQEIQIKADQESEATVTLKRWANPPKDGWYSADAHIHLDRGVKARNPIVSKMMQAEDIHVAALLQWGTFKDFRGARQYAFGAEGVYQEGDYLLTSGQENPRTYLLGHTLILGGSAPINFPDKYLIYKNFWDEARRQQALAGYAHGGNYAGMGLHGLAVDLPDGLLGVLEVLQAQKAIANYQTWYDVLNSGFRLAPTAGTDYPANPGLPGRERFYTQVAGPLTLENWLKGIRQGRTFVTNGPLLEFTVNGQGMGGEITLKEPENVDIQGRVRFDPECDAVERIEIVENGRVLRTFPRPKGAAEITCQFKHRPIEAGWLALRAWGLKCGEKEGAPWVRKGEKSPSLAHSGAIYVSIDNLPGLAASRQAKLLAAKWLTQLAELEQRLKAPEWPARLATGVFGDGVDEEYMKKNRDELLQRIEAARKYFMERSR
jgi:hypothetical protein